MFQGEHLLLSEMRNRSAAEGEVRGPSTADDCFFALARITDVGTPVHTDSASLART